MRWKNDPVSHICEWYKYVTSMKQDGLCYVGERLSYIVCVFVCVCVKERERGFKDIHLRQNVLADCIPDEGCSSSISGLTVCTSSNRDVATHTHTFSATDILC